MSLKFQGKNYGRRLSRTCLIFGYGSRTCLELDGDPVILRILWHDFVDFA